MKDDREIREELIEKILFLSHAYKVPGLNEEDLKKRTTENLYVILKDTKTYVRA